MSTTRQEPSPKRHRVVILCGPRLTHKHTCATLIRSGVHVVGICRADQRTGSLPVSYVVREMRRKGVLATSSRILARLTYDVLNRRQDAKQFESLFHEQEIEETLEQWSGEIHDTDNYSRPETVDWIRAQSPDILVAHTPYWIGKKVRRSSASQMVLGGHPGITPDYRGSHSSFWALYHNEPDKIGCSVFLLDAGVDTGDVVSQDRLPIEPNDSFMTLNWKGMKRTAELQAEAILRFDAGEPLVGRKVTPPANSLFDQPTLREYLRYRRRSPVR